MNQIDYLKKLMQGQKAFNELKEKVRRQEKIINALETKEKHLLLRLERAERALNKTAQAEINYLLGGKPNLRLVK